MLRPGSLFFVDVPAYESLTSPQDEAVMTARRFTAIANRELGESHRTTRNGAFLYSFLGDRFPCSRSDSESFHSVDDGVVSPRTHQEDPSCTRAVSVAT